MCGGIVSAISLRGKLPPIRVASAARPVSSHFAYNAGRICSYVAAGAVAGWIGSGALLLEQVAPVRTILYVVASLMLLAQGLYLAGLWRGVIYVERAGSRIWRHIQPMTRWFVPIDSDVKAFAVGALWGWFPCAMVYSVLATALATGHPLSGALTMLAFGLGTLPNLLAMALLAERVQPYLKHVRIRQVAGALILAFGVAGLVRVMQPAHDHASSHASDREELISHVRASH
jgi:sulfite exporter TauE/SafE